jgi:hypothetical protein
VPAELAQVGDIDAEIPPLVGGLLRPTRSLQAGPQIVENPLGDACLERLESPRH